MTRKSLYCLLFFILPLIYFLSLPISVGDLAIWIAHGKYFLETGHVLRHDIFSVLSTQDLVYPFGSSVLYAGIYKFFNLTGVSLFHKLVVLLLSWVWWQSSLGNFKSPWSLQTFAIVILCWLGTSPICIDRPALLATIPFLLSFLILQKKEALSWLDIFWLCAINIVWVNLHGSWLLLGVMYFWREISRFFLVQKPVGEKSERVRSLTGFGLIGLTSLLNPFGYKVFEYVLETTRVSRERGIYEWATTGLSGRYASQEVIFYLVFSIFTALTVYWFKRNQEKMALFLTSPLPILFLSGLHSVRNTIWPFVALLPACYRLGLLSEEKSRPESLGERKSVTNLTIAGGLLVFAIFLSPWLKPEIADLLPPEKRAVFDSSAPFAVAEFLNLSGNKDPVFNDWEYGSFLALAQSHPIFIDTRNIIYGKKDFGDYLKVVEASPDWSRVLEHYKIRYVLLNKRLRTSLISQMTFSDHWKRPLDDENSVLFERVTP